MTPGQHALLVNYQHLPVATPYRAAHAIFIREGATQPREFVDEIPDVLARRLLSIRAFDANGMMLDADVVQGRDAEASIQRFFENAATAYLHAHNAKQGCFAARIDRN